MTSTSDPSIAVSIPARGDHSALCVRSSHVNPMSGDAQTSLNNLLARVLTPPPSIHTSSPTTTPLCPARPGQGACSTTLHQLSPELSLRHTSLRNPIPRTPSSPPN